MASYSSVLNITGASASLALLSFLCVIWGIPLVKKLFPKTNLGASEKNSDLAESLLHPQKKGSSGIPWNILVVSRQDKKKPQFRKCSSKYSKHHRREDFNRSISIRMEAIQKMSDYEKLKYLNRHYFDVSFDFSIF